jgi:uncharacterized protein (TIGR02646 family)
MIRLARIRNDANGNPIQPNTAWTTSARDETDLAIAEGAAHNVRQSIYAHVQVRVALEQLFYDKCAYCETRVTAGSDWDVEHFRPKGAVAENSTHPGYFWLAYNWTNLFLACTFCNQRRQDRARWGDLSAGPAAGKLDQFPLAVEAHRAHTHTDAVDLEDPLLLNPCDGPDPEEHLRFMPTGMVTPRDNSAKGKASIAVYHLNRRRLKDARREAIIDAVLAIRGLRSADQRGDAQAAADFRGFLNDRLLHESRPYSGAARAVNQDPAAFGIT